MEKASLLDLFEITPETHDEIKSQLIKVSKSANIFRPDKDFSALPLTEKLSYIEKEVYKVLGRYKGFVKVIYTKEDLHKYFDLAIEKVEMALDTETNNSLDPLTCKLMGLCLYIKNTKPVYVPINHCKPGTDIRLENQVTEEEAAIELKRACDSGINIIYHNGKFDIRVCKNTLGFYPTIYWDTMLAAQMLDENESAKLKSQFKEYVDPTIDTYSIEKLFNGIPYSWVDPEIFALYSAIDAYDTFRLKDYQQSVFEQPGMERIYNVFKNIEVPISLVTAKMEDDGISLNIDFITRLNNKYTDGMNAATEELNKILKPYESEIIKYQNLGLLDNPVNYNSPPQLQTLLYDVLKIPPIDGHKASDKDTLKQIKHPFVVKLLEYRHFNKMITAFTSVLPELRSKKDNKIHAHFNQMGKEENNVRTGRFSSTDPNLQQIPAKEKVMRMVFEASTEYNNIEIDNNEFEVKDCCDLETDKGWVNSKDLKVGDCIKVLDSDSFTKIIAIEKLNNIVKIRVGG